jgi:hypothetical protein
VIAVDVGVQGKADRPFVKRGDGVPDLTAEFQELIIDHDNTVLSGQHADVTSCTLQHINILFHEVGRYLDGIPVLLCHPMRAGQHDQCQKD